MLKKQTSELSTLKDENDLLKRILNDAVSVCHAEKKQKYRKDTLAEMNLQHVGFASVIIKSLNACCAQETREYSPLQPSNERRWECCAEIVESTGVFVASNSVVAPYSRFRKRHGDVSVQ